MHRLYTILGVLAAGIAVACADNVNPPSGPQHQTPYAVIYGHIGAPKPTLNISVYITAYADSGEALAGGGSGFLGSWTQGVDTANNYIAAIPAAKSGTYFMDVLATGQGKGGYVSSVDTVRAIRVHFDSIGGSAPHDSVMVNDSLP